ncbi:hypothetical protein LTR62_003619 [Meristemomyces frigidus]|uniref:Uncharacterized protein n=1 Tax=Meristemomyces frigidus TaxID=1508187 RepID=A0AAN7TF53_9PEZI|nr:hypothetical protein LTR62_003619 [Meristemomyces frigidus]
MPQNRDRGLHSLHTAERPIARLESTDGPSPFVVETHGIDDTASISVRIAGLDRRDYLPTNGDWFFTGVDGLKVTGHVMNGTLSSYANALRTHINNFANSTAYGIVFMFSDSWMYQVCNSTTFTPLFSGRIIVEKSAPAYNIEDAMVPDCASDFVDAHPSLSTAQTVTQTTVPTTLSANTSTAAGYGMSRIPMADSSSSAPTYSVTTSAI